jgi:hypothetical protein
MGLMRDMNIVVMPKLENISSELSVLQLGFQNFQSQVDAELQNIRMIENRERLMIQGSVNDLNQRTVRQFRELLPQVVSKLEGALAPRDAQIVALGQACHSLVGNQNFLLQQTMHMVNPVQPGKGTDKVILGPDGSRSRGMPRANPDAASRTARPGQGGALQQVSVAP